MNRFLTFAIAILGLTTLSAQPNLIIAVQNGGAPTIFNNFTSAYSAAIAGDTIYLSGGTFTASSPFILAKRVHIIGVGYRPDSTITTNYTYLSFDINYVTGADNGSMTGCHLNGALNVGSSSSNYTVNNITISRCNLNNVNMQYYTSNSSANWVFHENIIRGYFYGTSNAAGISIVKNIFANNSANIGNGISYINVGEIYNNVFLYSGSSYYLLYNLTNCNIRNNVFMNPNQSLITSNVSYCTFLNNLWVTAAPTPSNNNTFTAGNIYSQSASAIFTTFSTDNNALNDNYQLLTGSAGKNAGYDGTDIGLFGTTVPFKVGGLPKTPHIIQQILFYSVNNQTGKLPVQVTVNAQDN